MRVSNFVNIFKNFETSRPTSTISIRLFSTTLLFVVVLIDSCSSEVIFHEEEIRGEVDGGNYSYYHLKSDLKIFQSTKNSAVVILLFSFLGDADLYVSRSIDNPTFEYGRHEYESTSCGVDRIDLNFNSAPIEFVVDHNRRSSSSSSNSNLNNKHLLSIGVYGHPSNPTSRYLLKILLFTEDKPNSESPINNWRLQDDEYMSEEMALLASEYRWRDWVQQVQVVDDQHPHDRFDSPSSIDISSSPSSSINQEENGQSFGHLFKATAEVLLAILSFALNILVEIMV